MYRCVAAPEQEPPDTDHSCQRDSDCSVGGCMAERCCDEPGANCFPVMAVLSNQPGNCATDDGALDFGADAFLCVWGLPTDGQDGLVVAATGFRAFDCGELPLGPLVGSWIYDADRGFWMSGISGDQVDFGDTFTACFINTDTGHGLRRVVPLQ